MRPRWPVKLPARGGGDRVVRVRDGIAERLLQVGSSPVRVRAWRGPGATARLRAEAIPPHDVVCPEAAGERVEASQAGEEELQTAISRWRFALALDDDMGDFFQAFKSDPLLGPVIRRKPWTRPRRRPWPWEVLAWSITKQLIDSPRAAAIQRRMVRRWGARYGELADVPSAGLIAGRAPAELVGMDLTEARALAMVRCAREVSSGRARLDDPACDQRLLAIREIGPWTIQCLGHYGRGDPDALPAGDLGFIKLIGHLAHLGRRATVEEVEEFFAPYAPFRGLAGTFALVGYHRMVAQGPPLKYAA